MIHTSIRCPYCNYLLQSTEPSDVGPEYRDCPACGKMLRTGQSEWVEMSASDQRDHIKKVIIQSLFGSLTFYGFMPSILLYLITIEFLELGWSDNVFIMVGVIGAIIGLLVCTYGVINEITESKARTSLKQRNETSL